MADLRSRPAPSLGAPPDAIPADPQLPQLSSAYWDRVRRNAAVQRASRPDPTEADQRTQQQNQLIAPPGPQPGASPGAAYRRGGKVAFEKSRFDVEKKGAPEGSPADEALDRKQMAAAGFGGKTKPFGFAKGGMNNCGGKSYKK